jgi:hypothetical protein
MNATDFPESDPRHQVANIRGSLDELITRCRQDTGQVDEPKAQALLETTAEVLIGLRTACEHYATGAEAAMRR